MVLFLASNITILVLLKFKDNLLALIQSTVIQSKVPRYFFEDTFHEE